MISLLWILIIFFIWGNAPMLEAFSAHDVPRNFVQRVKERIQQVPENNPTANPETVSGVSGVRYSDVFAGLSKLFPPAELDQRNALSRKDGYWPFINEGKDPPECFTYGEFDFYFFAELMDKAHAYCKESHDDDDESDNRKQGWTDKVFVDIGSGAGRLVMAAATLHPTWKQCRGIELLTSMHESAQNMVAKNCKVEENMEHDDKHFSEIMSTMQSALEADDNITAIHEMLGFENTKEEPETDSTDEERGENENAEGSNKHISYRLPIDADRSLPMAPMEFVCGSFADPYVHFGDADLIFMFSSALSDELLTELSQAIGRQCKPGTLVITTDYHLDLDGYVPIVPRDDCFSSGPFKFAILDRVDGWCWCTGGQATAYIHRLDQSAHPKGIPLPLDRPIPTIQDICFDVAMLRENDELTDSNRFLRGVANNVRFQGLPEAFVPRSYR